MVRIKGNKVFTPSGFTTPDVSKPDVRAELLSYVTTLKASLGT